MAEKSVNADTEIFPFPGKVRSTVWAYFGFGKTKQGPPIKENLNMQSVICKLCRKLYVNKETKKRKLDDHVHKLIVGKALPLSLVDSPFFKNFVKELDPRYKPPSRYDVQKSLDGKMRQMTVKLQNELPPVGGHLAITHDGWTSCATESYDTVTAHFINSNWELRSAVLQTTKVEGSHTGEHIAERLKEMVSDWNIPVPTVVTDNAANERKAIQLLGWERFGCYGHRLNLAVKHSLDVPEVSRILGKSRKIVTLFHQSTSLNDCLLDKQILVYSDTRNLIGHKLINDVPTRWNSTLAMLRRLSEQIAAILAIASDDKLNINKTTCNNLRSYCLTFEEQNIVEGLIKLLSPFEKATTILCAENSPTMNKVLVSMAKIRNILELQSHSESATLKKVVGKLQEQLTKRTDYEEIPVMAALLNPDTKSLSFLPVHEQEAGRRLLLDKALGLVDENGNLQVKVKKEPELEVSSTEALPELPNLPDNIVVEQDDIVTENASTSGDNNITSDCEPVAKKIKCSDMDEWFDDVMVTRVEKTPVSAVIEQEIERYLASNRDADDSKLSLLQWWEKNQYVYPRLAVLAKKYLAIPASSVPSERVFSLAGSLVNKKRSRLNPDLINKLIFLKMNMDQYW
ncbi:E3 SUMO-protein ligase ZBED1-like [Mercenaria mercenaria]|uniref:E3 SUMO-protein ligase ZBED1-like n=1 Tax=Mercenaria mercenaria TaxID=6596 RepID=UPI00234E8DD1|nr:E3 SUMO-protein ligase ZBED1-like [Mercenaria mercenaria]